MSLGVSQKWRALPQRHVLRGLSTIPRGFPVRTIIPRYALPIYRPRTRPFSRFTAPDARFHSTSNPEALSPPRTPPESAEPLETLRLPGQVTAQTWPELPPPAAGLMHRLAEVPVRQDEKLQSVLVPPPTRLPDRRERRAYRAKRFRAVSRQVYLERHRLKSGQSLVADWREILSLLVDNTPYYRPPIRTGRAKIVFPEQHMRLLAAGRSQIRSLVARSGCRMEVGNDGRHILISGTVDAVGDAVDRILQVESRVAVIALSGEAEEVVHDGTGSRSLALWKEFEWGPAGRSAPPVRPDRLPRPERWTTETLEARVRELTTTEMHKGMERALYTGKESHRHVVVKELLSILTSPGATDAISLPAVKMALAYCTQVDATFTRAIQLFDKVDSYRLFEYDSQTFNLLFEAAARTRDLVVFQKRLLQMTRRGLAPTLRTWILFLRLITSEDVRRHILHCMHDKNLMVTPRAIPLIAAEMAKMDAYRAIQLEQGLDEFLAYQNKIYGPEWLTTYAANDVLDVFGSYGKWDDMFRLLEIMCESTTARPTEKTMNIVITHCARQKTEIKRTLRFLDILETKAGLAPSQRVYGLLFSLAWALGKPQMLSVVWRYSLFAGFPPYSILSGATYLLRGDRRTATLFRRYLPPLEEGTSEQDYRELDPSLRDYADSLLLGEIWACTSPDLKAKEFPARREGIFERVRQHYKRRGREMEPDVRLSDILKKANRLDQDIWIGYTKKQQPLPLVPIEIPVRARRKWGVAAAAAESSGERDAGDNCMEREEREEA